MRLPRLVCRLRQSARPRGWSLSRLFRNCWSPVAGGGKPVDIVPRARRKDE
jgi:hypothetical protein